MEKKIALIVLIVVFLAGGYYFFTRQERKDETTEVPQATKTGGEVKTMDISSPVFENNQSIPQKYTCDGEDISPPLQFSNIPEGAKSLVLIVDDPDAPVGTWVHWVVFNINPETTSIDENSVPQGAVLGKNDFGKVEYGGPCPPSGEHRYFFKLYALDTRLDLEEGGTKTDVLKAMEGYIIEEGEIIGLYSRL